MRLVHGADHVSIALCGDYANLRIRVDPGAFGHDVDPLVYLCDVFARLPATPHTQIDQFLPDRWQKPAE